MAHRIFLIIPQQRLTGKPQRAIRKKKAQTAKSTGRPLNGLWTIPEWFFGLKSAMSDLRVK